MFVKVECPLTVPQLADTDIRQLGYGLSVNPGVITLIHVHGYPVSVNPRVHPFTDRSYYRRLAKMNDIIHTLLVHTLLVLT